MLLKVRMKECLTQILFLKKNPPTQVWISSSANHGNSRLPKSWHGIDETGGNWACLSEGLLDWATLRRTLSEMLQGTDTSRWFLCEMSPYLLQSLATGVFSRQPKGQMLFRNINIHYHVEHQTEECVVVAYGGCCRCRCRQDPTGSWPVVQYSSSYWEHNWGVWNTTPIVHLLVSRPVNVCFITWGQKKKSTECDIEGKRKHRAFSLAC